MEHLVGGKQRLDAIKSTANMVYESTKLFLNNNTNENKIEKKHGEYENKRCGSVYSLFNFVHINMILLMHKIPI